MIQLLELEDMADSMIGFAGFGLSIEAKKRVTIGVELASRPQLLLFLDEPTSGLDSQSAQNLVRFLRKLANAGQAILVTVHRTYSIGRISFVIVAIVLILHPSCRTELASLRIFRSPSAPQIGRSMRLLW